MIQPVPAWAAPYIGLPYADKGRDRAGCDCWGGVRLVLREVFGLALPDYADCYTTADDSRSVAAAVTAGLEHDWRPVTEPRAGDLLILKIGGRPWHAALMVTADRFLHWMPPGPHGVQSFSCIERLDSPRWAKRIDGFWRCTVAAGLPAGESACTHGPAMR